MNVSPTYRSRLQVATLLVLGFRVKEFVRRTA